MPARYNEVIVFSPERVTGGPEALHQLAYAIRACGGSAKIAYTGTIDLTDGQLTTRRSPSSEVLLAFRDYEPEVLDTVSLGSHTLLVYPETMTALCQAPQVQDYPRAVWWLSAEYAFQTDAKIGDASYDAELFRGSVAHFYQSYYALSVLLTNKASQYYPLSDFTDQNFIHKSMVYDEVTAIQDRERLVTFFPRKGGELAKKFEAQVAEGDFKFFAIQDMTKKEVREVLFRARIYIDFGHHPGRDRVPREAAVAGAIVFVRQAGAAAFFADYSLPDEYKFTDEDVFSGALFAKVLEVLARPETHHLKQDRYRYSILLERDQFLLDTKAFFFY